jgi:hypothetical protein
VYYIRGRSQKVTNLYLLWSRYTKTQSSAQVSKLQLETWSVPTPELRLSCGKVLPGLNASNIEDLEIVLSTVPSTMHRASLRTNASHQTTSYM